MLARALEGLAQEIRIMLDEGVVAAAEDIDLCMILGAGMAVPPRRDHALPGPDGIAAKVNGAPFRS